MPEFVKLYVRVVERFNYVIGRATMFMIILMVGVLFYSSIAKTLFTPALWTLEFSQFMMVAYFLLGGAYSLQLNGHVRMDLIYGSWTPRKKSGWDVLTSSVMIAYLIMLLWGGIDSLIYAFEYGERSYSIWRPYMWPIKSIMVFGITLMLLQAIAQFFKDVAFAIGKPLEKTNNNIPDLHEDIIL